MAAKKISISLDSGQWETAEEAAARIAALARLRGELPREVRRRAG